MIVCKPRRRHSENRSERASCDHLLTSAASSYSLLGPDAIGEIQGVTEFEMPRAAPYAAELTALDGSNPGLKVRVNVGHASTSRAVA